MARILVLTPRYPYPVIGGDRLRIHAIARELAKSHELTLLSLCDSPEQARLKPTDAVFSRIECVVLPPWRSALNALLALPSRTPLQVAYYRSNVFASSASRLAMGHDLVLSHLVRTAEYGSDFRGPRVLEMTDAISLNYARVRQNGGFSPRHLIYGLEQRRLGKYERRIVDHFDVSVFVSAIDRDYLFGGTPGVARTMVCSNGVDLATMPFDGRRGGTTIVFIGNMTTLQNVDAARWFADEILPLVRRIVPNARLKVVGRIDEHGRRLLDLPGVEVTGEVDDMAQAVSNGTMAVCPMRLGAGVQNKMLEYMAVGLATVSTQIGLEGLEAVPGRDIVCADGAGPFSEAVAGLLRNDLRRAELAEAGRRYVEDNHSWAVQLKPLIERIDALIGRHAA